MIDWATVTHALRSWVSAGAGATVGDRVIWAHQGGPRPQAPFVELEIAGVERVGQDWRTIRDNPASNGHDGVEVVRTAHGPRVLTLDVRCYAAPGAFVPGAGPVAILNDVMTLAPHKSDDLQAAGLGLAVIGDVLSTHGIIDATVLEPRAQFSARFHVHAEVDQFETYIQTVKYQGKIGGLDQPEVTVTAP